MTSFVAGATGYVGREVVRLLAAESIDDVIVAHVRHDSAQLERWQRHFAALGAAVDTTPWDERAMTATLIARRPTALFALLGTTRSRARAAGLGAAQGYEQIDYGLTALLVRAAQAARAATGVVPRIVYLSAVGVGPRARGEYLRVRWRMEEALRASGLPYVIARPSVITGPDREESRPMERMAAAALDALAGASRRVGWRAIADRWGSMTGGALAESLVRAARDPQAVGRVLDGAALRGGA